MNLDKSKSPVILKATSACSSDLSFVLGLKKMSHSSEGLNENDPFSDHDELISSPDMSSRRNGEADTEQN